MCIKEEPEPSPEPEQPRKSILREQLLQQIREQDPVYQAMMAQRALMADDASDMVSDDVSDMVSEASHGSEADDKVSELPELVVETPSTTSEARVTPVKYARRVVKPRAMSTMSSFSYASKRVIKTAQKVVKRTKKAVTSPGPGSYMAGYSSFGTKKTFSRRESSFGTTKRPKRLATSRNPALYSTKSSRTRTPEFSTSAYSSFGTKKSFSTNKGTFGRTGRSSQLVCGANGYAYHATSSSRTQTPALGSYSPSIDRRGTRLGRLAVRSRYPNTPRNTPATVTPRRLRKR